MRDIVYLVSTAQTGYFYRTSRNKKANSNKLKLKKYDPIARKHVEFVEESKVSKVKRKTTKQPSAKEKE